jgi:hypothetical protein
VAGWTQPILRFTVIRDIANQRPLLGKPLKSIVLHSIIAKRGNKRETRQSITSLTRFEPICPRSPTQNDVPLLSPTSINNGKRCVAVE